MPKGYSPIRWEQQRKKKEEYNKTYVKKPKPSAKPESVIRSKFSEGGWLSKKLYCTYY